MTKIILDQAALSKFGTLKDRAEVCDTTGRILGYFIPVGSRSLYEGVEPPITEEELQRRQQQLGGRTLAEILADLEKQS